MNNTFIPLTRFPPAALGMLKNLCLRIAALEQRASEARLQNVLQTNLTSHPATERFLDGLEFLHASHTRALRLHATALVDQCASTLSPITSGPPDLSLTVSTSKDPDEVLISIYSHLNELAAHYTRLQTLALAFEHLSTADLALSHLRAITPKIMMCSQAIPLLTADQALRRFGQVSPGCAESALEMTQAAWKNETQFPLTT